MGIFEDFSKDFSKKVNNGELISRIVEGVGNLADKAIKNELFNQLRANEFKNEEDGVSSATLLIQDMDIRIYRIGMSKETIVGMLGELFYKNRKEILPMCEDQYKDDKNNIFGDPYIETIKKAIVSRDLSNPNNYKIILKIGNINYKIDCKKKGQEYKFENKIITDKSNIKANIKSNKIKLVKLVRKIFKRMVFKTFKCKDVLKKNLENNLDKQNIERENIERENIERDKKIFREI